MGAFIHCVFKAAGDIKGIGLITVEHVYHKHLNKFVARARGNAGHARSIVGRGGNDAGHMRAVSADVIHLQRIIACILSRIHAILRQQVRLQVLVIRINARVQHRHAGLHATLIV